MTVHSQSTWAVVLAAGDGTRLRALTTDRAGTSTPKQYCSLFGESTLIHDAVQRARTVVAPDRVCAVVAAQHSQWWEPALASLPAENVIVQSRNRGTGIGVLLAVLTVLARDPHARLLFLPADHYVEHEEGLAVATRSAVAALDRSPEALVLVGIGPDEPDPELGYVVPSGRAHGLPGVERFVEKPPAAVAAELVVRGALWNSFIFAARGDALLELFRSRLPAVARRLGSALARGPSASAAVERAYAELPDVDFSRDVLEGIEERLRVVAAPPCGWTDLGTARRVGEVVGRVHRRGVRRAPPLGHPGAGTVTLADVLRRGGLAARAAGAAS
jgi:mannose-1-phosphate guanylyltransferase